jgi:hypothetical protein
MIEDKNPLPIETTTPSQPSTVAGVDSRYLSTVDQSPIEAVQQESGRIKQWWKAARHSGQAALVMMELTPLNEVSRLGVYGLTETMTRSPVAGAASLGLSTFVLEGAGGLAAAGLFETETSKKIFNAINEKGQKIGLPMEKNLSTPTKTWFTFMGGTVVGMALEQRENPDRTKEENRRYSLFTSAWQAGALAVIGAMGSEFLETTLEDPKKGALVAGGLAAIAGAGTWTKKKAGTIKSKLSKNKTN